MKIIYRTSCLLLLLAGLLLPEAAPASGSYSVSITKPPTDRAKIDRDKYDLGQKIFNGRTQLEPVASSPERAKEHQAILQELQKLLPKRQAKKTDLPKLAGRLSDPQLDALAYYVQLRYGPSK